MDRNRTLKTLLQRDGLIVVPQCHDALGAKIIESVGFDAVGITGYGLSASLIGKPDIGLLTMTEMVRRAREIVSAVNIPVICDADTGYGGINNVIRTVEEFEAAGVSAIHMEDQVTPKKCALEEGVEVIPLEEYLAKLRAAVQARKDESFVIMARTDARSVLGLEEAIRRGKAFVEAGADVVMVEGMRSIDEVKEVKKSIPNIPLTYIMQENSIYPYMTNKEVEDLGYKIVVYPITSTLQYAKSMTELMTSLKETGSTTKYINELMGIHDFEKLMGLPAIKERENLLNKHS